MDQNTRREPHRQCGNCGRTNPVDLGRKYCPVTARSIYVNKPADCCGFYIPKQDAKCGDAEGTGENVREKQNGK